MLNLSLMRITKLGEERAERIIRSKIDGTYKNKPVVVPLEKEIEEK